MPIEFGAGGGNYPSHLSEQAPSNQSEASDTKPPADKSTARKVAAQKKQYVNSGYDPKHLVTTPDGNVILDLDAVDHASFLAAVREDEKK